MMQKLYMFQRRAGGGAGRARLAIGAVEKGGSDVAITDWPAEQRPREKLAERGAGALTDAELLAIFLRTGVAGSSAVELGRELLTAFDGLRPLGAHDLRQLLKAIEGNRAELSAEHYAPLGNRAMLLRLQNNRKVRLLHDEHRELAVQTLEAMLMIAPAEPSLWHEAGLLHAHLGNLRAAVLALEQVMQLSSDPNSQRDVANLLKQLRGRIN